MYVINWSQNLILIFTSLFSFLFLPISLFIINKLTKQVGEKNIFQGSFITGFFAILLGSLTVFLNFPLLLLMALGKSAGIIMAGSGRSGLLSQKLKENPEEAGAIDTVFSPLGTAFGALISALIIGFLGYQLLFILGGAFVILVGLICKKLAKF